MPTDLELTISPEGSGPIALILCERGADHPRQIWWAATRTQAVEVASAFLRERGNLPPEALCDHLLVYTHGRRARQ